MKLNDIAEKHKLKTEAVNDIESLVKQAFQEGAQKGNSLAPINYEKLWKENKHHFLTPLTGHNKEEKE